MRNSHRAPFSNSELTRIPSSGMRVFLVFESNITASLAAPGAKP
jgi:hypothetical protein